MESILFFTFCVYLIGKMIKPWLSYFSVHYGILGTESVTEGTLSDYSALWVNDHSLLFSIRYLLNVCGMLNSEITVGKTDIVLA